MVVAVAREPYAAMALFLESPVHLIVVALESLTRRDRSFLHEVRRFSPDLRVLLLVSEARRKDVTFFLEAGADAILPHPFFPKELALLARAVLREDARDPLTGLPNRAAFRVAFDRERSRAERVGEALGLAILDLDKFRHFNQTLGYRRTDGLLADLAQFLRTTLRVTDLVARWGGDEFVVLLTGLGPGDPPARSARAKGERPAGSVAAARAAAFQTLDRLRKAVADTPFPAAVSPADPEGRITVKGGFALWPAEGAEYEALFDRANDRLKVAQQAGGNVVVAEDPPEA
jgi:GGDEF domain-containing protein